MKKYKEVKFRKPLPEKAPKIIMSNKKRNLEDILKEELDIEVDDYLNGEEHEE